MTLPRPPVGPPRKLLESSRAWRWAIVVGVAVISLLSGVGRVAIRPAALPTIPDRPVTSR